MNRKKKQKLFKEFEERKMQAQSQIQNVVNQLNLNLSVIEQRKEVIELQINNVIRESQQKEQNDLYLQQIVHQNNMQLQQLQQNRFLVNKSVPNIYQSQQEIPKRNQSHLVVQDQVQQQSFPNLQIQQLAINSISQSRSQNDEQILKLKERMKEEIREELRNEIRNEMIKQMPLDQNLMKQVFDSMAKIQEQSSNNNNNDQKGQTLQEGSKFGESQNKNKQDKFKNIKNIDINQESSKNSSLDNQELENQIFSNKKIAYNRQISNELVKYKFGQQIEKNDENKNKSILMQQQIEAQQSLAESSMSKSQMSQSLFSQDQESMDSDEKAQEEKLRNSYDEYGKMIEQKKKRKKLDVKIKQLKVVEEEDRQSKKKKEKQRSQNNLMNNQSLCSSQDDQSSKNSIQGEGPGYSSNIKARRYSLPSQNQEDIEQKQIKQLKLINRLKVRQNSLRGISNLKESYTEKNEIEKSLKFEKIEVQTDMLMQQMEDERSKVFNDIQLLIKQEKNKDIGKKDKFEFSQVSVTYLMQKLKQFNVDVEEQLIVNMNNKNKISLKGLLKNYSNILKKQNNYNDVQNIENESKTDEDEDSEQNNQKNSNEESVQQSNIQSKQMFNQQIQEEEKMFQEGKININKNSKNKISDQKKQEEKMEQSMHKNMKNSMSDNSDLKDIIDNQQQSEFQYNNDIKQILKDQESEEENNDSDQQNDSSSVSIGNKKLNQCIKSPSLGEIRKSPSYESLDSKHVRNISMKYDPKSTQQQKESQFSMRRDSLSSKSIQSKRSHDKSKFFMDVNSERSSVRRNDSLYRRDRMQGLELDYNNYLQIHQGIFVIRCQMMNIEFAQIQEKYDLEQMMKKFKNFKKLQKEIQQDEVYHGLQTIIIDIENTLITQLDLKSKNEFEQIQEYENFNNDYIVIKKNTSKKEKKNKSANFDSKSDIIQQDNLEVSANEEIEEEKMCCHQKGTEDCICDLLVYQVRPYTFEFLRAIQPFFEIVVFSKMHHKILEHIIDHIESVLNRPIKEFLEKYRQTRNKSSFQRMKKLPDIKIYFQFIIHQRQYIHITEHDKWIENLLVLTKNRQKDNLIFISSNPFRIIAAMKGGFLTIPVLQFESFYRDEFQLSLVEHYILKIRHLKDMKKRIKLDFKYLVQKIEKQPAKIPNYVKEYQESSASSSAKNDSFKNGQIQKRASGSSENDNALCFDVASVGSFGFKKMKKLMNVEEDEKVQEIGKSQVQQKSQFSSFRPRNMSQGSINSENNIKIKTNFSQYKNDQFNELEEFQDEEDDNEEDILDNEINSNKPNQINKQAKESSCSDDNSNSQPQEWTQQRKKHFKPEIKESLNYKQQQSNRIYENQKMNEEIQNEEFQKEKENQQLMGKHNKKHQSSILVKNSIESNEQHKNFQSSIKKREESKQQIENKFLEGLDSRQISDSPSNQESVSIGDSQTIQADQKQGNTVVQTSGSSKKKNSNISSLSSNEDKSQSFQDKKSQSSDGYNKYDQGRIVYDASCIILEESKSQMDSQQYIMNESKKNEGVNRYKSSFNKFGFQIAESLNEQQMENLQIELENEDKKKNSPNSKYYNPFKQN